MDHATFRELAAAAVLEDLDPEERVRSAAHRAACGSCERLVQELLGIAADLAMLAPPRPVPDALWGSVLAALAAETAAETFAKTAAAPGGPDSRAVLGTP